MTQLSAGLPQINALRAGIDAGFRRVLIKMAIRTTIGGIVDGIEARRMDGLERLAYRIDQQLLDNLRK